MSQRSIYQISNSLFRSSSFQHHWSHHHGDLYWCFISIWSTHYDLYTFMDALRQSLHYVNELFIEVIIMWTVAIYLHQWFSLLLYYVTFMLLRLHHSFIICTKQYDKFCRADLLQCWDSSSLRWRYCFYHQGCDCDETLGAVRPYCDSSIWDYG